MEDSMKCAYEAGSPGISSSPMAPMVKIPCPMA